MNPTNLLTTAEAAATIAKKNPILYDDLAKPSVQNLGKAFGTVTNILNTLLTPIELINETISLEKEKFLDNYAKQLSEIPEEKVCEPNPAILGPMTEAVKYKVSEKELRSKYAKLLAASSNIDHQLKPLLSFNNVLDQLSPYETELLKHIFPRIYGNMSDNIPIADVRLHSKLGYTIPYKNVSGISFRNLPLETISIMLSNLERLGLIFIDKLSYTEPVQEKYRFITEAPFYQTLLKDAEQQRLSTGNNWPRYEIQKGSFYLTDFGVSFVKTIIL